jgi:hypothetical protein
MKGPKFLENFLIRKRYDNGTRLDAIWRRFNYSEVWVVKRNCHSGVI